MASTMTTTFAVTVPGPTVTLAVSVEQVVGYLERTGWACQVAAGGWTRCTFNEGEQVWVSRTKWGPDTGHRLSTIEYIAMVEEREQADVLRDIAAVTT